ncbi:unnamed protein product [Peronospora belbahrii]|uniref:YTH domain-containing protein n=1 Tax=Peronospora belbahrii TaxID=622444 RepID=A0AAU9LCW1_9STRA|nr:unnamed protein product [Peronospora belbahrii]
MAATYFTYVTNVSNALETLIKTTGVRTEPAVVEFVSCGIDFHEHFVPKTSLKKHLRKCHGEKRARPIPNAAFFYGRRNEEDAVISHDKPSTSVNDSATGRQVQAESDSDIVADIQVPADDTECVDDERSQSSGFQSLVEPKAGQYDKQKTTLDVADGVIAAIKRAAVSATTFYEQVQAWHRIPHAFATINDRERALVKQSSLRRWLNAELSRPGVLPSGEALDQELVDYIVGLLEHPDFCEPDLLVLELHEFLGNNNVSNIVLALWKFLIVEIGLQSVFQKREKSEKKRTTIQAQSSVHSHDSMTTSAMLNNNSHTQASDAKSELHYKRRRASYRGKIGTNTGLEAYRDLIQKHMVGLSHEMDWDLVLGGGFQDDDDTHRKNRLTVKSLSYPRTKSICRSKHFSGVARMTSNVQMDYQFQLWEKSKYEGFFHVEWLLVKDVPNYVLTGIKMKNTPTKKSITSCRDCEEVLYEEAHEFLSLFTQFKSRSSAWDDFAYYDELQTKLEHKRGLILPDGVDKTDLNSYLVPVRQEDSTL